MKHRLLGIFLFVAVASIVRAHFVFVVPEADGSIAKVFLSETLDPDQRVDVALIGGTKLSLRDPAGQETPLKLAKAEQAYMTPLPGTGTRLIHGLTDFGISEMGAAGKPYLLLYHPKTIVGDAFDPGAALGDSLPVEIVPLGKPGALTLQLLVGGKPHARAEITVILPDGTQTKAPTDESGKTDVFGQTGRYGAWARYWEARPGERGGRQYNEVRHYATLVFDVQSTAIASRVEPSLKAGADLAGTSSSFASLPQATASFGAVASDGWLYVYGGHVSPTHSYFADAVSGRFDRMRLTGGTVWEELPGGPALQGMNLAAHKDKIYRIGGMAPRNRKGQAADNYSVADCARFDPKTMQWEALPPLPEPRSSHDVVVAGDKLIVTGGWMLAGADNKWMDTSAVMDLDAERLEWKSVSQPFRRRALIAAAYHGKMYVIGGINEQQKVVRHVSIYDPEGEAWSEGPELPDGSGIGFAPAAAVHEGGLYVSISDGTLFRLSKTGEEWDKVGETTPRVAHRMVSRQETLLVIGGAAKGNNLDLIEAVPLKRETAHSR